ncbi:DEAD/DEAH box helicase [Bacillus sp. DTU_2020_1000418_1_SI_GHA_SEK_038]|uniref:DEAD/DEAH box helicase n=1 Tax=Bacillus sp. DTU_2020_1000418_1_SI_GHA_SEK_038 TaxID=3077585 RepID=UPI0028EB5394|nr:DEAD/DEAH box helicase [Bacillus sp. DTU_2020_1000418_1_SI_GHA_SEK_038]WNS75098.1 DEAD/DEAH box helicase [Bacillus sp. DTU_2020_1000418_1_SI_GHA_SEK_038]
MRFAVIEGKMTPDKLLPSPAKTHQISSIESIPHQDLYPAYRFSQELQQQLSGMQLLLDDLNDPIQVIQEHYENGYLLYRKGILTEGRKSFCQRCGNKDKHFFSTFPCARCGEECVYCRKCIMMGRVSTCTPLISWIGPVPPLECKGPPLSWDGTLSDGQQIASKRVVEAVLSDKELLVWAVCGAGKTEVLFEGINAALTAEKRVCLATPRTDVVLELTPRLKKVFPNIPVASLYGGSEYRHLNAPLTIATTHQLLRFYHAFDTVILDEVDAFPYSVEETLQYAVRQSRKPTSSMIYLTATPNEKWHRDCRQGKRDFVTIPARFHRHPLPVPRFQWCGNWEKRLKKEQLPPNVIQWIKNRLDSNKQCLLFVPKIDKMEKILPLVQKLNPKIEAVHAEDTKRKEKVLSMRSRDIPMLLTTTILERGVTFPNIDVAVFGAEDRIFTESALVQIAGRVGRSSLAPGGDIVFFHYGKTEAMIRAKKQIQKMNAEARKKGLVDY